MAPSSLFRAMQPLRSLLPRSTTTTLPPFLHPRSRTSTSSILRLASTTTTPPQPQTSAPAPSSTVAPTSLRTYPYTTKTGTVVSVGRMDRTVRVSYRHTTWDPHLRKSYPKTTHILVSDPRNSLREGDVIEFSSGFPKSRRVRHVVERIVAPFGSAIEDRPAVMTREERDALRVQKRAAKWARREERGFEGIPEHVGRIRGLVHERVGGEVV
ncbi:uS17 family ribosomal protein [Aspergillus clavatus NRRL 1]|uniref:Nucleic acid-binding protein n=1 Tax=Aspergillus clavatus (strain ATCC 1007 / CBS 513.65 / DSM 816 / NCTC 3887 / NRRL 1 / QM 1276 / 107) TaxID=344612 RepID=A1CUD5_ASPCL|nr:uncharacterized protein ACLA_086210 [Aspergillus clavatus NRRL 1]EAW06922.1 conserved hypothetical protein [Aspergillus clavatus NRRL 1]